MHKPKAGGRKPAATPRKTAPAYAVGSDAAVTSTASVPPSGVIGNAAPRAAQRSVTRFRYAATARCRRPPARPPRRWRWRRAPAPRRSTSPRSNRPSSSSHKGRQDEATNVEGTISDPVARKLVEWVILRSDDSRPRFPALRRLHRGQSELAEHHDLAAARRSRAVAAAGRSADHDRLFPQRSAAHRQGPFCARARAARRKAISAGAQAAVREAWRKDSFSADLEAQARDAVCRPDHAGRRQGAHGRASLRRGRRRRPARGAPSRRHRSWPSPRRAPRSSTNPPRPRRCSKRCRRTPATIRAICSAAFNGCAAATRSPKPRNGCWRRRANRNGSAISISGGSSAGSSPASFSTSAIPSRPMRSPTAPLRRSTTIIAPSSNSPPAGSRCASCTSRRSRSPHFARIADGASNPITLARSYYWQGRAAGGARTRAGRARLL